MKPNPPRHPASLSRQRDPWTYLLAAARHAAPEDGTVDLPPDDFSRRVVAAWLRPRPAPPVSAGSGSLWEALGLRAALLAGAAVAVALSFEVGALRQDFGSDVLSIDPTGIIFGLSL